MSLIHDRESSRGMCNLLRRTSAHFSRKHSYHLAPKRVREETVCWREREREIEREHECVCVCVCVCVVVRVRVCVSKS